jgi:hypothetical protein
MKLLINTTGVSFNPFSAVSARGVSDHPAVGVCLHSERGDLAKPATRRGSARVFGVTSYHQNSLMRIRSSLMSWVSWPNRPRMTHPTQQE